MGPASAIGVASSAITFLEISYKFARTVYNIYDDNKPSAYEQLATVTQEMETLSAKMVDQLQPPSQSLEDLTLATLVKQCYHLSSTLLLKIKKTNPEHPKFRDVIRAAARTVFKAEEIRRLQHNLENCRSQLHLQMHLSHRYVSRSGPDS